MADKGQEPGENDRRRRKPEQPGDAHRRKLKRVASGRN